MSDNEKVIDGWFTTDPPEKPIRKCEWRKKTGPQGQFTRCDRYAARDSLFCWHHQPKGSRVTHTTKERI